MAIDLEKSTLSKLNSEILYTDWELDTGQLVNLTEDSISKFSSIILPISYLDKLYYIDRNILERYVQGGGGIVVWKDTILDYPVWPITRSIQSAELDVVRGQGRIEVIDQLEKADWNNILMESIGNNRYPNYSNAITTKIPDANRYIKHVLVEGLDEPMQMQILPNNDVLIVERKGGVKLFDSSENKLVLIARLNVFSGIEDGLLGVVLDPNYDSNHWVYFYYAVAGDKSVNRLSRMVLRDGKLDLNTEKILLEIPTQRQYCCHSAGYLYFDNQGLLYLSVGDNTNAEETEGYIPIDERPNRMLSDDQATAANTNDLRGKILRIKPEEDGTYSIPKGNLFPEGMPNTRPEIYIMGSRNPYRFSVDSKKNILYWGDVGPDTKVQGEDGLMSYDELNRAEKPGFYGWPYFLGNNQAFPYYDFETKEEGPRFNPKRPINQSPNNTGLRELPEAQPAFIWYGKGSSVKFPLVGKGGASAMAGPIFYADQFKGQPYRISDYYDGKLFIYEWLRNWILAVEFDDDGNMVFMEPFLDHFNFSSPVDMVFGPDGALYVLEYGTNWFSKNNDAILSRIEYIEGNRSPVVRIQTNTTVGAHPLKVKFDGAKTIDYDGDSELKYYWTIDNVEMQGVNVEYVFEKPGIFDVALEVHDQDGGIGKSTTQISVGNSPPDIQLEFKGNKSFYRDKGSVSYQITVQDAEDGLIDGDQITTRFGYLENKEDLALVLGDTEGLGIEGFKIGKKLIGENDCQSCHSMEDESVGPSYREISKKYYNDESALEALSLKIIKGGSGNWGSKPMTPHPDMKKEESEEIVKYILSLAKVNKGIPANGIIDFDKHNRKNENGAYILTTKYRDKGGAGEVPAIESELHNIWESPKVEAEMFDDGNVGIATITTENLSYIRNIRNQTYVKFKEKDLTDIKALRYRVQPFGKGGEINVHLDQMDGPIVSTIQISGGNSNWEEISAAVKPTDSVHDLFFVFSNLAAGHQLLFNLDWIYFEN
ncbi:hypothetical protein GCM10025777_00300 [Membranihabitans marinus]